jgi:phage repressor protein C with HTH and peptisase S24 domain
MYLAAAHTPAMLKAALGDAAAMASAQAKANLADNPSQLENAANEGCTFSNLNQGASSTGAVVVKSSSGAQSMSEAAQSCSNNDEDAEMQVSGGKESVLTEVNKTRGLHQKPRGN